MGTISGVEQERECEEQEGEKKAGLAAQGLRVSCPMGESPLLLPLRLGAQSLPEYQLGTSAWLGNIATAQRLACSGKVRRIGGDKAVRV